MLEAAKGELGRSGSLSLASAAEAAGVTKPGLMYHFATKAELMTGLLDHVIQGYEDEITETLAALTPGTSLASSTVAQRLSAYLVWASRAHLDPSDLVMVADPRLRDTLIARWVDRLEPWLAVPRELPVGQRSRLLAARLMADGIWFDRASGAVALTTEETDGVTQVALDLLGVDR